MQLSQAVRTAFPKCLHVWTRLGPLSASAACDCGWRMLPEAGLLGPDSATGGTEYPPLRTVRDGAALAGWLHGAVTDTSAAGIAVGVLRSEARLDPSRAATFWWKDDWPRRVSPP